MSHPAAAAPRPARAQPPADPALTPDHPPAAMPPPSQPARAPRAAQPPRCQPPLDHARISAYRPSVPPRTSRGPPGTSAKRTREGRRLPGPDHGGVAHEKGQPCRAALPAILTTNDASSPLRPHSLTADTGKSWCTDTASRLADSSFPVPRTLRRFP